jgi:hypothetical protein
MNHAANAPSPFTLLGDLATTGNALKYPRLSAFIGGWLLFLG